MLFDNLPLPLPWYSDVTLQDRFRQNVAMNAIIIQLGPKDGLLPFQLRKPTASILPDSWVIKCAANGTLQDYMNGYEDTTVVDLSAFITTALEWLTFTDPASGDDYDYFIFKHEKNSVITGAIGDLPPGVYYSQMVFGTLSGPGTGGTWSSETYRVPRDPFSWNVPAADCNYPCFKWSHNSDIIPIHYDEDDTHLFFNLLYLDTWITASEPEYETEGVNDGFNEFHPTFQKMVIKYRLSALIPDYIKIAIHNILLHENKYLFTNNQLRQGDIKNLEVSSTPTSDGALSVVEMLFEQMSLVVQTNCENNMVPPDGISLAGTYTLTVHACAISGEISIIVDTIPEGYYCELWANTGAGPYSMLISHISRADALSGCTRTVGPPASYSHYKLILRTFTAPAGETTIATPIFDLC